MILSSVPTTQLGPRASGLKAVDWQTSIQPTVAPKGYNWCRPKETSYLPLGFLPPVKLMLTRNAPQRPSATLRNKHTWPESTHASIPPEHNGCKAPTHWLPSLPSQQFQVLFNSLFKVLFIFPSQYLFAIGLSLVFSFRWNLPPT